MVLLRLVLEVCWILLDDNCCIVIICNNNSYIIQTSHFAPVITCIVTRLQCNGVCCQVFVELSVNRPPPPEPASPSHTASSVLRSPSLLPPSSSSPLPSSSVQPGESALHSWLFAETPGGKRTRQPIYERGRTRRWSKEQRIGESIWTFSWTSTVKQV